INKSGRRFSTDSLPALLMARGYESTFIDSYYLKWNGPGYQPVRDLGFRTILDAEGVRIGYDAMVEQETKSMALALDAVLDSERRGRKAFVVVSTYIGHYDWIMPAEARHLPVPAKMMVTAKLFDTLMARFLDAL